MHFVEDFGVGVVALTPRNTARQKEKNGVAERLRYERIRLGKTQKQIAELADIPIRTYRDWEEARTLPRTGENLEAVSGVLRVPAGWLLTGDESYLK